MSPHSNGLGGRLLLAQRSELSELTAERRVDQPVYDQARAAFGTHGLTDMLCLIGAYQTVCGILNAFDIPAPEPSQACSTPTA